MNKTIATCIVLLFFVSLQSLVAMTAQFSDCDTLYTKEGKMHFVKMVSAKSGQLVFTMCDDPSGTEFLMPSDKISHISVQDSRASLRPAIAEQFDPLIRKARIAAILGIISSVAIGSFIFSLPGVVFAGIAVANGERILRSDKTKKLSPLVRKRARTAVITGMAAFMLVVVVVLLFSLI